MPVWLQVVWSVMAPLLVLAIAWLARTIVCFHTKLVEVRRDIAAINERCAFRGQQLEDGNRRMERQAVGMNRIDRNVVRLGAKIGAEDLEVVQD